MPALNDLATAPSDDGTPYGERVHIVHAILIEAHPQAPDLSPFSGSVWEVETSTVPQAFTYEERMRHARLVPPLLRGEQTVVVDALEVGGEINPIWCTYGPAANAMYLMRQDGTLAVAEVWTDAEALQEALNEVLARHP